MSRQNEYIYEGPLTEKHLRTVIRFAGDRPAKLHVGREHYAAFVADIMPSRVYHVGTPSDDRGGEVYFQYENLKVLIEPDGECGRIGVSA